MAPVESSDHCQTELDLQPDACVEEIVLKVNKQERTNPPYSQLGLIWKNFFEGQYTSRKIYEIFLDSLTSLKIFCT